jgi:hypothetical protein
MGYSENCQLCIRQPSPRGSIIGGATPMPTEKRAEKYRHLTQQGVWVAQGFVERQLEISRKLAPACVGKCHTCVEELLILKAALMILLIVSHRLTQQLHYRIAPPLRADAFGQPCS